MNHQLDAENLPLEMLTLEHGQKLKEIALNSILAEIEGTKHSVFVEAPILRKRAGVFVTLRNFGELRGCVGYVEPVFELWDATGKAAVHAAFSDPRFRSVHSQEMKDMDVEISVLGHLEAISVKDPHDIGILNLGTEGLVVRGHGRSGLLLPQVATELELNPMEFLQETCLKAGLSKNAWKTPGVEVYKFAARIF